MNPRRLLLVEDDLNNRLLLEALLQDEGFEVISVTSLAEAHHALSVQHETPWFGIVCDRHLPDGDGLTLREHPTLTTPGPTRYVLCSGSALAEGTPPGIRAVDKSLGIEALLATLLA